MFGKKISPLVKRTVTPKATEAERLTARQQRAVVCLIACSTVREAAKEAGISERTLRRWLAMDRFHKAVRDAGRRCVEQAGNRVQGTAGSAIEALNAVLDDVDASASSRVMAARTALTIAYKVIDLQDTQDRIRSLEKLVLNPDLKWKR